MQISPGDVYFVSKMHNRQGMWFRMIFIGYSSFSLTYILHNKSLIEETVYVYGPNSRCIFHLPSGLFLCPQVQRCGCVCLSPLVLFLHCSEKAGQVKPSLGDFCQLSARSFLTFHSREMQRQKIFHFKALRPSPGTPLFLSWMSRTDAAWPKSHNRIKTLPEGRILSCPCYQLWTGLKSILTEAAICPAVQFSSIHYTTIIFMFLLAEVVGGSNRTSLPCPLFLWPVVLNIHILGW